MSMSRLSLRKAFGESPGSLRARASSVGVTPRCTVREIVDAFNSDIVFGQRLVTADGVPFGGEFKLVLHRDGQWDFTGYFHATGFPSYRASLMVTVGFATALPSSATAGAFQAVFGARGLVHGSNEAGNERYTWSQQGSNSLIKANWTRVRTGTFGRRLELDADWFAQVGDLLAFFGEIILMNGAFGPAGTAIALAGEIAGLADVDEIMLPGLVGVALAAGVVYLVSPGLMIPAFIAGALATPALIRQSPLSEAERNFADKVFNGTIPYDRIIKTNLLGAENRAFTMPVPGNAILLNVGDLCYDDPINYDGRGTGTGDNAPGQLFIHELTHAWQIAHDSFTPWLYCRGSATATASLWDGTLYGYGSADAAWSDLGIEQQAQLVCDWFAGSVAPTSHPQKIYEPMRDDSAPSAPVFGPPNPYFRYIRDHIWAEVM
jgi:hypothetical protein